MNCDADPGIRDQSIRAKTLRVWFVCGVKRGFGSPEGKKSGDLSWSRIEVPVSSGEFCCLSWEAVEYLSVTHDLA
jgi:hypothetical protein